MVSAAFAIALSDKRSEPVTPVPDLDLGRYLGLWHEIARLPMLFQRNCKSDVTARYTARNDSTVAVHNSCLGANGNTISADGIAKVPDRSAPAKIKVTFAPSWISSWLPFVWADYWVLALDEDYQWALVGEPGRRFLWILSRNSYLDQSIFENLKNIAVGMGYNLTNLIVSGTVQKQWLKVGS